jgi:hypothetical protein
LIIGKKDINGVYKDIGIIELETGKLEIPFGTGVRLSIEYNEIDFKSGSDGIVWATYYKDQAETIQGALQAHKIDSQILEKKLEGSLLFLIKISDKEKTRSAIDFIWRGEDGLKLKPDWVYPTDKPNESFERWTKNI